MRMRGQGKRGALPSTSIMLRQPMNRFAQMQATDIDIYRKEVRKTKGMLVCPPPSFPPTSPETLSRGTDY